MLNAYLLLLLPIFTLQFVAAQNFAPVGAKWYYTQVSVTGPEIGYTYIESLRDTVIDGVECREIGGSPSGCAWSARYMYDSNDSVFFWHPEREEFCLLYDFGAQVGDTWSVHHLETIDGQPDSTVVLVDSVGTDVVSGKTLKVVYTTKLNQVSDWWGFGGKMVERIGGGHLFPTIGVCDPLPGELRCYQDSVINFHQGLYECDEAILSIDKAETTAVRIYPNPAKQYLTLKHDGNFIGNGVVFELLDISGKLALSYTLQNTMDETVIDLRGIKAGNYTYRIISNGRMHYSGKVVVAD